MSNLPVLVTGGTGVLSARAQREVYLGPWLPEPLITGDTTAVAAMAALTDSLSMAFLIPLEKLSPVERAVFLLREVFDYEYGEIAAIVNKSEANYRQMVKRAKEHIAAGRPRFEVSLAEQKQLTLQFMEACATGNMDGLLNILAEDIILWSDGGGKAAAARRPVHGPDRVARFLLGICARPPKALSLNLQRSMENRALSATWTAGPSAFCPWR